MVLAPAKLRNQDLDDPPGQRRYARCRFKSTLLANLVLQDIVAGYGVAVIDPKSNLVGEVLARVPEHRVWDIIVADTAATKRPVGFNILRSAQDEQSKEPVVDHVVHLWHKLYKDFWGPRSEDGSALFK